MGTPAYNQICKMATSENPKTREMARALLAEDRTPRSMLRAWHSAMDAPVGDTPKVISPQDFVRRSRMALEEQLELIQAAGLTLVSKTTGEVIINDFMVVPVPDAVPNMILIADGLADVQVINEGTAVELGIDLSPNFDEAMWSNGTKIDETSSRPIKNKCLTHDADSDISCDGSQSDCVLMDPSAPLGKILKPSTYVAADFGAVLDRQMGLVDNQ